MHIQTNIILSRENDKPILLDVFMPKTVKYASIVIFCHGYKGFKDWGAWSLMGKHFADHGFCFVKFNFSHNGGTVEQPIDFPDLEAFGQNNYSKELEDLQDVINWAQSHFKNDATINVNSIYLIGHSRGGGIVTICAEEDSRIKKVVTLAGVSDYESRFVKREQLENWRITGVRYVINGRTKQKMPHYYQFYEDFISNKNRLTIKRAVSNLKIPLLIIHGDKDTSVSLEEAQKLHQWQPKSELIIIEGADHVFNTRHPCLEESVSKELLYASKIIIAFLS